MLGNTNSEAIIMNHPKRLKHGHNDDKGKESDIPKLEAPIFSTINKGQPEPMLRLTWSHKVNLVGSKIMDPMIHCCDRCLLPILIYGRMIPCKHVFCLSCANKDDKVCFRCKDKVLRVEQGGLGSIFMCTYGGSRYENDGCRRTYLSQRDLQSHVNHRHTPSTTQANSTKESHNSSSRKETSRSSQNHSTSTATDQRYESDTSHHRNMSPPARHQPPTQRPDKRQRTPTPPRHTNVNHRGQHAQHHNSPNDYVRHKHQDRKKREHISNVKSPILSNYQPVDVPPSPVSMNQAPPPMVPMPVPMPFQECHPSLAGSGHATVFQPQQFQPHPQTPTYGQSNQPLYSSPHNMINQSPGPPTPVPRVPYYSQFPPQFNPPPTSVPHYNQMMQHHNNLPPPGQSMPPHMPPPPGQSMPPTHMPPPPFPSPQGHNFPIPPPHPSQWGQPMPNQQHQYY